LGIPNLFMHVLQASRKTMLKASIKVRALLFWVYPICSCMCCRPLARQC
jgi:hypothetical protein